MGVTVPENNARYCKTCQEFLPLDEFCPGPRRYYCRRHLKELTRKQHIPKTEAEKIARVLWVRCWKDSATYFGQSKLLVSHREVLEMCSGLSEELRSKKNLPYLVPWKPLEPLERTNLALVSRPKRKYLIEVWKASKSPEKYQEAIDVLRSKPVPASKNPEKYQEAIDVLRSKPVLVIALVTRQHSNQKRRWKASALSVRSNAFLKSSTIHCDVHGCHRILAVECGSEVIHNPR